MPRIFVHLAFILFIITALTGLWMRAIPFMADSLLHYDHILHGHSHIAILGWAFFSVFIIFLFILWEELTSKRQGVILAVVIFIVSLSMFVAFLYEGYATYSIILSTLHIFVEYWAVYYIYKQSQASEQLSSTTKIFMNGALISLAISSIGPFSLGYLGATGLRETVFFEMSIYFFLHFQYNGWLFLALMSLFFTLLNRKKINFSTFLSKAGFWIYFSALFPWFISALLWTDSIGTFGKTMATVGSLSQAVGVLLMILSIYPSWLKIKEGFTSITVFSLVFTFLLLSVKSLMEVGLIVPSLANLVFETRSVIIGYLHLTLLGLISLFILTQFQMLRLIDPTRHALFLGTGIFIIGFLINEGLLFLIGLMQWLNIAPFTYTTEILLFASFLLLIGISLYWTSTTAFHKTFHIKTKKYIY